MSPLDVVTDWIATDTGTCAFFGFATYALWTVWRKLATRWDKWFPLATKLVKWGLYGAGAAVLILFLQALAAHLFEFPGFVYAMVGAGVVPSVNKVLGLRRKETVRRGARVGIPADVNRQTRKLERADLTDCLSIGGVNIPHSAEPYHLFVVGSTGSGKSVAITQLMDDIERRGDIALVVDSGGEFCSRYYTPGRDYIINPFDARCAPWSPTAEMAGPWDAESLAKSMVPDGTGDSKEWNGYAQTFVTAVIRRLAEIGRLSIKDLLYTVQAAPIEDLTALLAGTSAAAQLTSDKTFGSIRTIAANYLGTYSYLEDNPNPFSVSKFIVEEKPGFIFITYREDQLDSVRNMVSCVLDIASRTILALPASKTRRVWLIIDEFASIGKVQSIEAVATKARKMGGCLLLGLQSVSQLQDRYGDKTAQTILSCLSSWLVLRCSDVDTAEYISKYIGDSEISRMTRGESSSESGGSDSLNEQIQTQRAVMPVELQRLANLQGYFKLAGDYPICRIKLEFPERRKVKASNYAHRDFLARPMLDWSPPPATPAILASSCSVAPAQAETLTTPATAVKEAQPRPATIKSRKQPINRGPVALEKMLLDLALEDEARSA